MSGVPVKVPVVGLKLSQLGSGEPSARVALRLRLSPASTSLKVWLGSVKLKVTSSVALWLAMLWLNGASLLLATVSEKSLLALAPEPSVAVTRTFTAPTSPLSGVPVKVPVLALKLSQLGSGEPSASVALRLRLSPTSTSLKVWLGRVKLKAASSVAPCAEMGLAVGGLLMEIVTESLSSWLPPLPVPPRSLVAMLSVAEPLKPLDGVKLKPFKALLISAALPSKVMV